MILYNVPHSNFGAKVLTAVAIKGIGDLIEVQEPPGGLRSDTYRVGREECVLGCNFPRVGLVIR